jgi:hypothetical protein
MKVNPRFITASVTAALLAVSVNASSRDSASAGITTPTVVVTVIHAYNTSFNSTASYALYNGGDAVSMDAQGNITVSQPTDIRFILANSGGYQNQPIGISFKQTNVGMADPTGATNFSVGSIAHGALVIHDDLRNNTDYEYSLIIQRSDGLLSVVDPQVRNRGVNM